MAKAKQATFTWSDISREQLTNLLKLIGNDGHSIYPVSYLRDAGVDERVVKQFVRTYKSDGSLKGSIERNGQIVDSMSGIYGLTVLWSLASFFNVDSDKMGRGSQAQELTEKIKEKLNS